MYDQGRDRPRGSVQSGRPLDTPQLLPGLRVQTQNSACILHEHPLVGDTRMVGLMGAFELVKSKEPLRRFPETQGAGIVFRDLLMEEGVCLRAVGNTIICAPPFVLSHGEADELIGKTRIALDRAQKKLLA